MLRHAINWNFRPFLALNNRAKCYPRMSTVLWCKTILQMSVVNLVECCQHLSKYLNTNKKKGKILKLGKLAKIVTIVEKLVFAWHTSLFTDTFRSRKV